MISNELRDKVYLTPLPTFITTLWTEASLLHGF